MFVFYHIICLLVGGFLAAWAMSLNDLRYDEDSTYSSILVSLFTIALFALALGVATLHV